MVTDPIADLIVQIKNGGQAKKEKISVPFSKLKESIAHVLVKQGFLKSVEAKGKKIFKTLELELAYHGNQSRVTGIQRISKSSRRIYQKAKDIRMFKSGFGSTILSTPNGIMSDSEAKKAKVGGEVLFKIW